MRWVWKDKNVERRLMNESGNFTHERWCPLCTGYSGPFPRGECMCADADQSELYYDAIERFRA